MITVVSLSRAKTTRIGFKIFLAVTLSFGLTLGYVGSAWAHFLGYDAVDTSPSPPEIQYTILSSASSYSYYITFARDKWNGLSGGVTVRAFTGGIPDVRQTASWSSDTVGGRYTWYPWEDKIWYNTRYFDDSTYSVSKKRNIAVHELGHAHGLDHSFSGQVMYDYISTVQTPQYHDIADYNTKWG